MNRTQWVVTLHFGRNHNEVIKFDTKAAALECIRITVFANEDCINFSCYKEEVKKSSIEQKLDDIKYMLDLKDRILNKI